MFPAIHHTLGSDPLGNRNSEPLSGRRKSCEAVEVEDGDGRLIDCGYNLAPLVFPNWRSEGPLPTLANSVR